MTATQGVKNSPPVVKLDGLLLVGFEVLTAVVVKVPSFRM
jgi:hypothetical protein